MVDAAERRFEAAEPNRVGPPVRLGPEDDSAFGLWESNLILHQEVEARTRRVRTGERLLRSVVDSLDTRMCILSNDGTIIGTNRLWDEFAAEMGWYVEQAGVGGDFFVLVGSLSGDLEMTLNTAARQVLFENAGAISVKGSLRLGNNREDVVVRMNPVVDEGAARAVVTLNDVTSVVWTQQELHRLTASAHRLTDRMRAEKAVLSEVLGSIPHLVYWKDQALRYSGVNQTFLALRGLDDESSVVARTEAQLASSDRLSAVLGSAEARVLATGQAVENERLQITAPGRGVVDLLLSVLPQIDPQGRVCGVIGVGADVTQLTLLEHQVAQATRLESIGQLAAGIAHEINTPVQYVSDNTRFLTDSFAAVLTALHAADQLAAGDGVSAGQLRTAFEGLDLAFLAEEIPGALSQSQEGLARVSEIIRAMKDFAHPGTGRAEADLNRAVRSTVMVSRNEWRYVAVIDLELDPAVGMVRCFEGDLKQVMLNIVVNAAQAIAAERIRTVNATLGHIGIRTERTTDGITITIEDDGPGMDDSVRRRVFDPFFTTKPVGQGTGQGLSLAYAVIVQKHGGTLAVSSVPGAGAQFCITLPDQPETEATLSP
jgi:two-component system NtrC family sensor kinase